MAVLDGLARLATGVALSVGLSVAVMLLPGAAQAAERLNANGARLADAAVDISDSVTLTRTISLGGDAPGAFYVTANLPDGRRLQRNNLGYWVPWNGRRASLIDNQFAVGDDQVTYKILRQNIADMFFPITITLGYRVDGVIKYGVFDVQPEQ
ncbi:MAG: hypothetical protein RIM84_14910 [Alphaproteobacteria bacterium]